MRITLNEEDFAALVAGKAVRRDGTSVPDTAEIILADIGFSAMLAAIRRAMGNDPMRRLVRLRGRL